MQALGARFPLTAEIEHPAQITSSLDWAKSAIPSEVRVFRGNQRSRLHALIAAAQPYQDIWNSAIPEAIRGARPRFKSLAFRQRLSHLGPGGDRWVGRFFFGFPTTGELSQNGVFSVSEKFQPHSRSISFGNRPSGSLASAPAPHVIAMRRRFCPIPLLSRIALC